AVAAAALMTAALAVAGVVLYLPASKGTIRVEIADPEIVAVVAMNGFVFRDGKNETRVEPGEQTLKVRRGDVEVTTDTFLLKRGETVGLKVEFIKGRIEVVRAGDAGPIPLPVKPMAAKGSDAWKPTAAQQSYLDAVAGLPVANRVESVTRKLREI